MQLKINTSDDGKKFLEIEIDQESVQLDKLERMIPIYQKKLTSSLNFYESRLERLSSRTRSAD
jgi:hypothetical protein